MRTTTDYLDALKTRLGVSSDYQLSKVMKVRQSLISNYRTGRSHFDDAMAIEVAKTLEVDPGEVLAAMQAERTKCPAAKKAWQRLSESLMAGLLACFIGVSGMAPAPVSASSGAVQATGNLYIMRIHGWAGASLRCTASSRRNTVVLLSWGHG